MCLDKLEVSKFKWVCTKLLDFALLTKTTKPGEVQVTYAHASVGNTPLRETVTAFTLVVSLETPSVATTDDECAFIGASNKICIPTTEVLL